MMRRTIFWAVQRRVELREAEREGQEARSSLECREGEARILKWGERKALWRGGGVRAAVC